jgi:hypothetical protein
MPKPGDRYAQAFTVEPGQCWAMIHDEKLQADHCPERMVPFIVVPWL